MSEVQPIETAPVELGKRFGPCLLWSTEAADTGAPYLAIGYFDGKWWTTLGFGKYRPTH